MGAGWLFARVKPLNCLNRDKQAFINYFAVGLLLLPILACGSGWGRSLSDELLQEMRIETAYQVSYQKAAYLCDVRCSQQSKSSDSCLHNCQTQQALADLRLDRYLNQLDQYNDETRNPASSTASDLCRQNCKVLLKTHPEILGPKVSQSCDQICQ